MSDESATDLSLNDGKWTPTSVLADCPEGGDVSQFLDSQGWEDFLSIGEADDEISILSWRRHHKDKPTEYLLEVSGILGGSPFMVINSFPELMDLITRWAPAVQAASISYAIRSAWSLDLDPHGLVETIAARAAYGIEKTLPQMTRHKRDHDAARRARRAAAPDA